MAMTATTEMAMHAAHHHVMEGTTSSWSWEKEGEEEASVDITSTSEDIAQWLEKGIENININVSLGKHIFAHNTVRLPMHMDGRTVTTF